MLWQLFKQCLCLTAVEMRDPHSQETRGNRKATTKNTSTNQSLVAKLHEASINILQRNCRVLEEAGYSKYIQGTY